MSIHYDSSAFCGVKIDMSKLSFDEYLSLIDDIEAFCIKSKLSYLDSKPYYDCDYRENILIIGLDIENQEYEDAINTMTLVKKRLSGTPFDEMDIKIYSCLNVT